MMNRVIAVRALLATFALGLIQGCDSDEGVGGTEKKTGEAESDEEMPPQLSVMEPGGNPRRSGLGIPGP